MFCGRVGPCELTALVFQVVFRVTSARATAAVQIKRLVTITCVIISKRPTFSGAHFCNSCILPLDNSDLYKNEGFGPLIGWYFIRSIMVYCLSTKYCTVTRNIVVYIFDLMDRIPYIIGLTARGLERMGRVSRSVVGEPGTREPVHSKVVE